MSHSTVNDELPEAVVSALKKLERLTGRIPIAVAVAAILGIGVVVTACVVGANSQRK